VYCLSKQKNNRRFCEEEMQILRNEAGGSARTVITVLMDEVLHLR